MTYPASSKIQNLNDCTPLLLWLTNITVDQFILLMSGINIYALRSPYSIRAMNDCVTEVVFVVNSERHTRSRCMWALCTVDGAGVPGSCSHILRCIQ